MRCSTDAFNRWTLRSDACAREVRTVVSRTNTNLGFVTRIAYALTNATNVAYR
jgi:hypothetical protein